MFEKFLRFVGNTTYDKATDYTDFFEKMKGATLLKGMYRFFSGEEERKKWEKIVFEAFPDYRDYAKIFAFDWLGRIFASDYKDEKIMIMEPGTGEVLSAPMSIEEFHDNIIPENPQDSLAADFFNEWYEKNNHYVLKHNECAGYKVPLFLNGDDALDNLEVSDMEVYWGIMAPLMNL